MGEYFRRAKSEWASKFLPGHWALGLQKFPLVRFHDCAWFGRTGDSWSVIAGRSGTGPYRRRTGFCIHRRGGYQPPVQPFPSMSGGNGRRPKGVGMMSRSDRGDRDRCPRRGRMRVTFWPESSTAGGPRASPTQSRKSFLRTVGEGLAPPAVPGYGGPASVRPLR